MGSIFSFRCSCCDKVHEGSPSFAFNAPAPYLEQPDQIKNQGYLEADRCYYQDNDGDHYFIRVVLEIPIHGVSEPFIWGVWASLSHQSYHHYQQTFDSPDIESSDLDSSDLKSTGLNSSNLESGYFGWLCNYLPGYANTYALASNVQPQGHRQRPIISLHETDHELYHDFIHGISIAKAQEIAEKCIHS